MKPNNSSTGASPVSQASQAKRIAASGAASIAASVASPSDADTFGDLTTTYQSVAQADLFRLLGADALNNAKSKARFHAVEDAIASRVAGKPIDTSLVDDDDMNVRTNSNDTTNNYYLGPPKPRSYQWVGWVIGVLALALLTITLLWVAGKPPAPVTPPAPASGEWVPKIEVK